jgi:hypothetical protein
VLDALHSTNRALDVVRCGAPTAPSILSTRAFNDAHTLHRHTSRGHTHLRAHCARSNVGAATHPHCSRRNTQAARNALTSTTHCTLLHCS